ncbi:MAG: hypothetical protein ACLUKE_03555 [Blautia wexlerae]
MSEGNVGVGTAIIRQCFFLLGVLVGVFNGFLITVLKMPAFIATLASSKNVTAGLALYISMGKTIIGLPFEYSFIGLKKIAGVPFCAYY